MKKKVRLRKYRESDLKDLHVTLSEEATKRYFSGCIQLIKNSLN